MKSKDSNSQKSVSYQKEDGRGHARPSFFWYGDDNLDLKVCFLVTHLINLLHGVRVEVVGALRLRTTGVVFFLSDMYLKFFKVAHKAFEVLPRSLMIFHIIGIISAKNISIFIMQIASGNWECPLPN